MTPQGAQRLSRKIAPQIVPGERTMPFYLEIKRRARILGFAVLGVVALFAAWHFVPAESGPRAPAPSLMLSLGFAGVSALCFVMAAAALAALRRQEEGKAEGQ